MTKYPFRFIYIVLCACLLCGGIDAYPQNSRQRKTESTRSVNKKKAASKKAASKSASPAGSGKRSAKKSSAKRRETSADVRKQELAARKDIEQTKARIAKTDKEISKGLGTLEKIRGDIDVAKKAVADASAQVKSIEKKIEDLESDISENENQIKALREEYLKAIKKMRARRGSNSDLAFIFSSGSFNQAMRRMRYLSQFSAWRTAQSSVLSGKVNSLKEARRQLAMDKVKKDEALRKEASAQQQLNKQYSEQDAIVVELRKNSSALKSHLAAKQAEANTLRNRISALIAEEQARAEEQRRKKLEEERKEKERREQQEKAEAAKKERERLLAESDNSKETTEKTTAKSDKENSKKEKPKKDSSKKADKKKDKDKNRSDEKNYAEARKRKPRSGASAKESTATAASGANFERLKGSLPRPVSGSFRITSKFGRHPLPELPEVMYDNPGIDAEVAKGSSAQAIATGKVTGVYVIPGYNTVVIVSHGNYYSVYGNLASPSVSVGQNINQGQVVGTVAAMEDNPSRGSIHFEIWKNREKLNPENWIR